MITIFRRYRFSLVFWIGKKD